MRGQWGQDGHERVQLRIPRRRNVREPMGAVESMLLGRRRNRGCWTAATVNHPSWILAPTSSSYRAARGTASTSLTRRWHYLRRKKKPRFSGVRDKSG